MQNVILQVKRPGWNPAVMHDITRRKAYSCRLSKWRIYRRPPNLCWASEGMGKRNPHQDCLSTQTTKWVLSRSRRYLRLSECHLYKQGFSEPGFPPALKNPWRKNDLRTAVELSLYDHGWNVWNTHNRKNEKCTISTMKLCKYWRDAKCAIVQFLEQWLQGLWDRIKIE